MSIKFLFGLIPYIVIVSGKMTNMFNKTKFVYPVLFVTDSVGNVTDNYIESVAKYSIYNILNFTESYSDISNLERELERHLKDVVEHNYSIGFISTIFGILNHEAGIELKGLPLKRYVFKYYTRHKKEHA